VHPKKRDLRRVGRWAPHGQGYGLRRPRLDAAENLEDSSFFICRWRRGPHRPADHSPARGPGPPDTARGRHEGLPRRARCAAPRDTARSRRGSAGLGARAAIPRPADSGHRSRVRHEARVRGRSPRDGRAPEAGLKTRSHLRSTM
jgi:hypothetical protein